MKMAANAGANGIGREAQTCYVSQVRLRKHFVPIS